VRLHGQQARSSITGITLLAGFASTVGWPLSAWMEAQWGWRGACLGWAGLHLVLGLPLNLLLPKAPPVAGHAKADAGSADQRVAGGPVAGAAEATSGGSNAGASAAPQERSPDRGLRTVLLLSFVFSGSLFVSTALASHLPQLLMAAGVGTATAVALGGLIGPAQVAGRLLEFGVLQEVHPLLSGRIASALHPLGVAVLFVFGAPGAAAFCLLHGAGNGILTIAKAAGSAAGAGAHRAGDGALALRVGAGAVGAGQPLPLGRHRPGDGRGAVAAAGCA